MTPERYARVRLLFDELAEIEGPSRVERLRALEASDPEIHGEIVKLLASSDAATGFTEIGRPPEAGRTTPSAASSEASPNPGRIDLAGTTIAGRYRLEKRLGAGGMGEVYQAFDLQLNETVALKTLMPELAQDKPTVQRFLQEVSLARRISHSNVVRIFDFGEAEGTRFLTMEYLEGETLHREMQRLGRIPPHEAARWALEIARGMQAAHDAGVIHRDLKPQNIMMTAARGSVVMDFGIALAQLREGSPQLTTTGKIIGTPDYMSPEQAIGAELDFRSDIYSFGLILYRMLSGKLPFSEGSGMASLVRRNTEEVVPLEKEFPQVPRELARIAGRCLKKDRSARYQSAAELAADLAGFLGPGGVNRRIQPVSRRAVIAAGGTALVAAGAWTFWRASRSAGSSSPLNKIVRLLIADFDNTTADEALDGTLEPVFSLALEDASFLSAFSRAAARRVAGQLLGSLQRLDAAAARLVATREGVDVILAGTIGRQGSSYRITAALLDATTGSELKQVISDVGGKERILRTVPEMTGPLREALGDAPVLAQKRTAAETFSAHSLEAAHLYSKAQDLALVGKWDEAIAAYQETLRLDPQMGRAWSGLAVVYRNIGRTRDAVEHYQKSLQYLAGMTDREKYRTRGGYYVTIHSHAQAVSEFTALVSEYPADTAGHANLALAYLFLCNTAKALEEGRKAVAIYPGNIPQRNNVALYAMYAGQYDECEREATAVLKADPKFAKAFVARALSQLARGNRAAAAEHYNALGKLSPRGASMSCGGLADLALSEGRNEDAIRLLEQGVVGDAGDVDARSRKLIMLGQAHWAGGNATKAVDLAVQALAQSKDQATMVEAALLLADAGKPSSADRVASEFASQTGAIPRHYGKLIEAWVRQRTGKTPEALLALEEAGRLLDSWLLHWLRARHFLERDLWTEASSELDVCRRRDGEGLAVFMDDVPTYRYVAVLDYYRGLAEQSLSGTTEALRRFVSSRSSASPRDRITSDAQARLRR